MPSTLAAEVIEAIVQGEHGDPFAVLGPHEVHAAPEPCVVVRAFLPDAREVTVFYADGESEGQPMKLVHPDGLFEVVVPMRDGLFPHRLRVIDRQGQGYEIEDPYRFPPILSDYDLHLMGEGNHFNNYEKLGAHLMILDGVPGVGFAVWAPNAKRVSVVGDFNDWDGRPRTKVILGELIRGYVLDHKAPISKNDAIDLQHAAMSVNCCDYVLLDGPWAERIEKMKRRIAKVGTAMPIAKCFSRRSNGVEAFLADLDGFVKSDAVGAVETSL